MEPQTNTNTSSLERVSSMRVRLERHGRGTSLVTEAPQPAVLTFSLVSISRVRPPAETSEQPLATLAGQISAESGVPTFVPTGELVSLVPPATESTPPSQLVFEFDERSFGNQQNQLVRLPPPEPGVRRFEVRVGLEVSGSSESAPEVNDLFDFNPFRDVEITLPKIVSLGFTSAHNNMLDNNKDLLRSGSPVSLIHWKFGKASQPASHTMGKKVSVNIELELHPFNADETDCEIEGKSATGSLEFSLKQKLGGGKHQLSLTSAAELAKALQRLEGDIQWTVRAHGRTMDAGASFGHRIYVTFGTPTDVDFNQDQGITEFRIATALRFIAKTGKTDPHAIVQALMANDFPEYAIQPDRAVDAALKHPTYFNDQGGAWRILENLNARAECQAIVRVVQAMIQMVGMSGRAEHVKVSIERVEGFAFEEPGGIKPEEGGHGLRDQSVFVKVNGVKTELFPFLVPDEPSTIPLEFSPSDPVPSLNFFESCLKFSTGTAPNQLTKYYAGGTGGAALNNPAEVIGVFKAAIYCKKAFESPDGKTLRLRRVRVFTDIPRDPDKSPPDPPLFSPSELAD